MSGSACPSFWPIIQAPPWTWNSTGALASLGRSARFHTSRWLRRPASP